MEERRRVYSVLVEESGGKRPLGRPKSRREDNFRMGFQEVVYRGMDRIKLAHERDSWRTRVNAVMNLRIP